MTKYDITPKWTDVKPMLAYVYIHIRLSDGLVFYVGKGKRRRGWDLGRSVYWKRVAEKHGVRVEIAQDGMTEEDAHLLEMWLIARFRHEGLPLVNMTDGGEGWSGMKHSDATKKILSDLKIGDKHHNFGKKLPKSTTDLMTRIATGEGNPFFGKSHTEETKLKISMAHQGEKNSCFNPTVYDFWHPKRGCVSSTQNSLRKSYDLSHSQLSCVCSGKQISHQGWRLVSMKDAPGSRPRRRPRDIA